MSRRADGSGRVANEADFGTIETQKRGGGVRIGYTADGSKVATLKRPSHLANLADRGLITDEQWTGGERLWDDAKQSGQFAYIKSSADFSVKGNRLLEPAEYMVRARLKLDEALQLLDLSEYQVVHMVIMKDGYMKDLDTWQLRRNGMLYLRSALDKLIKFYGI